VEDEKGDEQSAMKNEILEIHAEFCKTFANPIRLEILNLLKENEMIVTDITERLGVPKANTSRHLNLMRLKKIIVRRRKGVNIYYSIANKKIVDACTTMQNALGELLDASSSSRN